MKKIAILLINLGTPASPKRKDVFTFLNEFLLDGRVIDIPFILRQLLVRCVITPFRSKLSSQTYQKIWTDEGSPLMLHSLECQKKLQNALGEQFIVELAMRYQKPSIRDALNRLEQKNIAELMIFPLFPQYASATTGSIFQKVMEEMKGWQTFPKMHWINHFYQDEAYLNAFCQNAKGLDKYEHFLFSFHGLPQRQLIKASPCSKCLQPQCCKQPENHFCYSAQCYATAEALMAKLGLAQEDCTICFQSRLGKEPWIQPYTNEVVHRLAEEGVKKVLVFCPAFVSDCLETLYEIGIEYRDEFKKLGGETLDLYPGLNSSDPFISALKEMIFSRIPLETATL